MATLHPGLPGPASVAPNTQNDSLQSEQQEQDEKAFWKTRMRKGLRLMAAHAVRADISTAAARSPLFVRGFENAPNDGALILPDSQLSTVPEDQTDRFFSLLTKYKDSDANVLIPIDFKSFDYSIDVVQDAFSYGYRTMKNFRGQVILTAQQVKDCQALVISGMNDPDWVAFIPRYYYSKVAHAGRGEGQRLFRSLVPVAMARFSPLPPLLAPFVMHKNNLPEAFENMVTHLQNPGIRLRNPYSGIEYLREGVAVEPQPFSVISRVNDPELDLRYKIWKAFDDVARTGSGTPEFLARNPLCCPITANLRLDHVNGTSIFVEIKRQHARVSEDGTTFQYMQYGQGLAGGGIFTFEATWDYLLTMVDDKEGYLIRKESIPTSFWHQDPGLKGWMTHKFPDASFLNRRRVLLYGTSAAIVENIARIITYTSAESADDSLIIQNSGQAGAGPSKLGGGGGRTSMGGTFTSVAGDDRSGLAGHLDANQDATLFLPLMRECRRMGKGCMIDLGKFHPFGRMAMIKYDWSEEEKECYDRTGKPPCWAGMLPSATPMVTLCSQWNSWRSGYAPVEGTVAQVELYRTAHPCLVACSALPTELAHMAVQQWIVPSEFMPMIQIGDLIGEGRRAPLILKGQHDIEEFIVTQGSLHATVYEFFSGKDTIHIGFHQVPVKPRAYLKTIRDYKTVGEQKFEVCGKVDDTN
ncbi:uncharacterized protein Z520_02557 [Fonsecaea multimorphosa CBS 102226]|uniref:Uncharacterized protein n=1 Tax=Fonsecaea multimorphosa CBS 102226 TaxID=1442371 RepID=A0A0D2K8Q1_9EURO|nr:uncharacterized protein Z520_02557 [Fonsecaea multimorphosa CBS 102226]KIY02418.1 hypothetical protein Z520_02557 [Fonsecaea multimorphosa CBS 102226]OAL29058.1 hypothetical protein AYO22_02495 [Fonsecaea multimorphosa]